MKKKQLKLSQQKVNMRQLTNNDIDICCSEISD